MRGVSAWWVCGVRVRARPFVRVCVHVSGCMQAYVRAEHANVG
jgi:hypothetical protein